LDPGVVDLRVGLAAGGAVLVLALALVPVRLAAPAAAPPVAPAAPAAAASPTPTAPAPPSGRLPIETYVAGVVAAEMPAAFPPAALAAQAVAARTFGLYSGACDAAGCRPTDGQAYRPGPVPAAVAAAVAATRGVILTYGGRPVAAFYSASSGGESEDAARVWGHGEPYLVVQPVPEDPQYRTTTVALAAAAARLGVPPAALADPQLVRDASGRVAVARFGAAAIPGTRLRALLGLPSTWVTAWQADGGVLRVVTRGHGHGVGLSQDGAAALARRGWSWQAILAFFYPGTALARFP
jgi:stage II sporulation protein D